MPYYEQALAVARQLMRRPSAGKAPILRRRYARLLRYLSEEEMRQLNEQLCEEFPLYREAVGRAQARMG